MQGDCIAPASIIKTLRLASTSLRANVAPIGPEPMIKTSAGRDPKDLYDEGTAAPLGLVGGVKVSIIVAPSESREHPATDEMTGVRRVQPRTSSHFRGRVNMLHLRAVEVHSASCWISFAVSPVHPVWCRPRGRRRCPHGSIRKEDVVTPVGVILEDLGPAINRAAAIGRRARRRRPSRREISAATCQRFIFRPEPVGHST